MKKLVRKYCCLLMLLSLLAGCKAEVRQMTHEIAHFKQSTISFPDKVIKIKDGAVETYSSIFKNRTSFVIYYGDDDCQECNIAHLSDLTPIYSLAEELDIDIFCLFSPEETEMGETIEMLKSSGFGYDINEGVGFGISTGLYYSYLAGKVTLPGFSIISGDMVEHALNIPVKAGYSVPVGSGLKGFLNVGPTFVCGLSSKIKPLGVDLLETDLYKHEYLGRFDIMVGGAIGAELNDMIRISVGYDFGMLDQFGAGLKGKNDDGSTKDSALKLNRNRLTVGLAFMF